MDTLSSMTSLNLSSGFASRATSKGNKIGILAFEVVNTIIKGENLKQSLSEENVKLLKEEVLRSEGFQWLVSNDMDELLKIAAADKKNELNFFTGLAILRRDLKSKRKHVRNLKKKSLWSKNLDEVMEKLVDI
ncbi:hypothetical protein KI387_004280, partial [Taxus chinensis]